jgi:hypothetical protein
MINGYQYSKNGLIKNLKYLVQKQLIIIRIEESPEKQGKMLSDVVKYLESELVNVDSFSDAYFYKK